MPSGRSIPAATAMSSLSVMGYLMSVSAGITSRNNRSIVSIDISATSDLSRSQGLIAEISLCRFPRRVLYASASSSLYV